MPIFARSISAALLVLLAGCAALKGAESPTVLRLSPIFPTGAASTGTSVSIAPVQPRGVTGDRRYAYVDRAAPGEIRQAATIFWEEAPTRIIERALVQGLRSRLGAATGPEVVTAADLRLIARLDRFEEITGAGGPVLATVALDVTALADRKAVLTGRYCAQAPVASSTGSARARAFEEAMQAAIGQLAGDLLARRVSSPGC